MSTTNLKSSTSCGAVDAGLSMSMPPVKKDLESLLNSISLAEREPTVSLVGRNNLQTINPPPYDPYCCSAFIKVPSTGHSSVSSIGLNDDIDREQPNEGGPPIIGRSSTKELNSLQSYFCGAENFTAGLTRRLRGLAESREEKESEFSRPPLPPLPQLPPLPPRLTPSTTQTTPVATNRKLVRNTNLRSTPIIQNKGLRNKTEPDGVGVGENRDEKDIRAYFSAQKQARSLLSDSSFSSSDLGTVQRYLKKHPRSASNFNLIDQSVSDNNSVSSSITGSFGIGRGIPLGVTSTCGDADSICTEGREQPHTTADISREILAMPMETIKFGTDSIYRNESVEVRVYSASMDGLDIIRTTNTDTSDDSDAAMVSRRINIPQEQLSRSECCDVGSLLMDVCTDVVLDIMSSTHKDLTKNTSPQSQSVEKCQNKFECSNFPADLITCDNDCEITVVAENDDTSSQHSDSGVIPSVRPSPKNRSTAVTGLSRKKHADTLRATMRGNNSTKLIQGTAVSSSFSPSKSSDKFTMRYRSVSEPNDAHPMSTSQQNSAKCHAQKDTPEAARSPEDPRPKITNCGFFGGCLGIVEELPASPIPHVAPVAEAPARDPAEEFGARALELDDVYYDSDPGECTRSMTSKNRMRAAALARGDIDAAAATFSAETPRQDTNASNVSVVSSNASTNTSADTSNMSLGPSLGEDSMREAQEQWNKFKQIMRDKAANEAIKVSAFPIPIFHRAVF